MFVEEEASVAQLLPVDLSHKLEVRHRRVLLVLDDRRGAL